MRRFRRICKHLDQDTTIFIVNAIVCIIIDYSNSLLHGVPPKYIIKLQKVQNTIAQISTRCLKYTSSKNFTGFRSDPASASKSTPLPTRPLHIINLCYCENVLKFEMFPQFADKNALNSYSFIHS